MLIIVFIVVAFHCMQEEELDLLKHSSRLVHHIATPLLLSPHWRQRSMRLPRTYDEVKQAEEKTSDGVRYHISTKSNS